MFHRDGVHPVELWREAPAQIPVATGRKHELAGDRRAALQAFLGVESRLPPSSADLVQHVGGREASPGLGLSASSATPSLGVLSAPPWGDTPGDRLTPSSWGR